MKILSDFLDYLAGLRNNTIISTDDLTGYIVSAINIICST